MCDGAFFGALLAILRSAKVTSPLLCFPCTLKVVACVFNWLCLVNSVCVGAKPYISCVCQYNCCKAPQP